MDTYAVVLYFDAGANDTFKAIINDMAIAASNYYMIDVNIPPHITVGSFLSDDHVEMQSRIEEIKNHLEGFTLTFDCMKAFEPHVLFASPIKDSNLDHTNRLVHEAFLENFIPADQNNYLPENWIPHCALAVKLDRNQLDKAMAIGKRLRFPIFAEVEQIALTRCNPYREIAIWNI